MTVRTMPRTTAKVCIEPGCTRRPADGKWRCTAHEPPTAKGKP